MNVGNSDVWRLVAWIMLIMLSMLIGLLINTGDGDVSLHCYMIGSFILPLIVTGVGWILFPPTLFYIGRIIKRIYSE